MIISNFYPPKGYSGTGERRKTIQTQVEKLDLEVGGEVRIDQALLDEVTKIVEAPMALRGNFDKSHLNLRVKFSCSVMKNTSGIFRFIKWRLVALFHRGSKWRWTISGMSFCEE
jgi:hypothetical protein